jgi:PTS system glucose-specific IIC component
VTIYGVVERMLLPFGLHHIWNVPFFFEVGTYIDPDTGEAVHGVLSRYFAGDYEAAILGGGFVFKMFGLPAAALAIYHTAKPENKARVAGIMGSAALTSFLTGITEPLEFAFLFVAPLLYAAHAVLVGIAYLVTYLLDARLGYSFSHGFIDYALYWVNNIKPWIILILGPIFALVYYVVFRTLILKLRPQDPGPRGGDRGGRGLQGHHRRRLRQGAGARLRRQEQHRRARRLHHAPARRGGGHRQGRPGQAQGHGRRRRRRRRQQHAGHLRAQVRQPEDRHGRVPGPRRRRGRAARGRRGAEGQLQGRRPAPPRPRPQAPEKARAILAALGGAANVQQTEAAAETRLRVALGDASKLDEARSPRPACRVMRLPDNVLHLIVGLNADQYAAEMKAAMAALPSSGRVANSRASWCVAMEPSRPSGDTSSASRLRLIAAGKLCCA